MKKLRSWQTFLKNFWEIKCIPRRALSHNAWGPPSSSEHRLGFCLTLIVVKTIVTILCKPRIEHYFMIPFDPVILLIKSSFLNTIIQCISFESAYTFTKWYIFVFKSHACRSIFKTRTIFKSWTAHVFIKLLTMFWNRKINRSLSI